MVAPIPSSLFVFVLSLRCYRNHSTRGSTTCCQIVEGEGVEPSQPSVSCFIVAPQAPARGLQAAAFCLSAIPSILLPLIFPDKQKRVKNLCLMWINSGRLSTAVVRLHLVPFCFVYCYVILSPSFRTASHPNQSRVPETPPASSPVPQ